MIMTVDSKSLLLNELQNTWPVERWFGFGVIVAVSGGADSVALLRALREIQIDAAADSSTAFGKLFVAHFNHKLRGPDSDADCDFVRQLANELELEFLSESSTGLNSSENALRDERYQFLEASARKTNSRYIATAHHRDDQIETVLFRVFRGTGLKGLAGIPQTRVVDESLTIVRPMLNVDHQTVLEALASWNQLFRTDSSNFESNYSRNFIRNEILPLIRTRFSSADDSISRLSLQAAQHHEYLSEQVTALLSCAEVTQSKISIDCKSLRQASPVVVRELLVALLSQQGWLDSQLGFEELDRLSNMILQEGDEPKFQLPGCLNCESLDRILCIWK